MAPAPRICKLVTKYYTAEQIKALDDDINSVAGNSGASQEAGWYWQENDPDGNLETGPCGPFKTRAAARADGLNF